MILVVDPEAPQTISVCKRSQRAQLFVRQRPLQFVSCFYKCHARNSSTDFRPCPPHRQVALEGVCLTNIGVGSIYWPRVNEECQRPANADVEPTPLAAAKPARAKRWPSILKSKWPIATACAVSKAKFVACKKWSKTTATARTSSRKSPACRKRCAASHAT